VLLALCSDQKGARPQVRRHDERVVRRTRAEVDRVADNGQHLVLDGGRVGLTRGRFFGLGQKCLMFGSELNDAVYRFVDV